MKDFCKVTLFVLIAMLAIFLCSRCGCKGDPLPAKATVVGKYFVPARDLLMPMFVGKVLILIPQHTPPQFYLDITWADEQGKQWQRRVQVSEADYNRFSASDEITFPPSN